jgi:DNA-binding CsgD family transcriptional regulator
MITGMSANAALTRGRAAFEREAWAEACRELAAVDARGGLEPDDLDRLATAAYLVGEEVLSADARARAHAGFLERGQPVRAARSAFWLAFALTDKPATAAQAGGWLARARRILDECGLDCVERGLLLCALGYQRVVEGDMPAAIDAFDRAAAIGARFRDPDVTALARHGQARGLIRCSRTADGFALMDEVMVAVAGGEVTPMVAGVVYCSVISACHDAFDLRRAQEWTTALAGWCAAHPDMVPFRAQCLIRRSELLQLHGAWHEAVAEAQRAADWSARTPAGPETAAACYQQGELHRLRGDFARADEWYRRASQAGRKPYPGLALLRLAQGQLDAAETTVRCMLSEVVDRRARARVLGACVEVLLARQDVDAARAAAGELSVITAEIDAPFLRASLAHALGAVSLASGDAPGALQSLRQSWALWREFDAPYEIARVRVLLGAAYRQMGDEDGAQMEFEAAQETFERLGASADAARVAALLAPAHGPASGPLTGREVEVLRLVAAGKTNRAIGAELAISEKTVARHMSNIFTKLNLTSRAAATAYAYEHKLL